MREILFRGKRAGNGEWVEGYLQEATICSAVNTYVAFVICKKPKGIYDSEWYEIDPDTVGQYTGLKDKSGKKIFEGDIVKSIDGLFLIRWCRGQSAFLMTFYDYPYEELYLEEMRDDSKIIGNIYDNPELLEAIKCD